MSTLDCFLLNLFFLSISIGGFFYNNKPHNYNQISSIFIHPFLNKEKININEVQLKDLLAIDDLSQKNALKIYNYLTENHPQKIQALLKIKGIGPKTIQKLANYFKDDQSPQKAELH